MAKKKFLGLQYPLAKSSRGILAQKVGVDQIKADLLQLLLTNPGERVMLPTYGTPLRKLIFEPNDNNLLNNVSLINLPNS
jgi:phage baseplate assembly protein W